MRAGSNGRGSVGWRTAWALLVLAGCSQDVSVTGRGEDDDSDSVVNDSGVSRVDGGSRPPEDDDGEGSPITVTPGTKDCNQLNIAFGSPRPTVFILVDRSSSMFEQNFWDPLKAGVLEVVKQLEADVEFGFSTYTGQRGGMCPELTTLDRIGTGNYSAIKQAYDGLTKPTYKGETPTAGAIEAVTKLLSDQAASAADVTMSPTVILLVTDGEPDFCDDPNVTCSRDAVVGAVQAAKAKGIGTFIFSIGGQVDRKHLGDVANAGIGQPVADRDNSVMYQCPAKKGTYSAASGSAPYFEPNVNDQSAIVSAISNVVSSVRSCVFDLQGKLKIELEYANEGTVEIDGERVPYNTPDGFRMNSATQLELLGGACERLRKPESKRVFIDFPCESITLI
jgi:hypothetical protein